MIIDTHAHVVPGSLIETVRSERRSFPSVRLLVDAGTIRMAFAGEAPTRPIATRLSDLAQRREWLTSAHVDHQVIGGWTELQGEEGADWARCFNEHLTNDAAALVALRPLATEPSQDGARAARVLEEALDNGLAGAIDRNSTQGWAGISTIPSSTCSGRSPRRAYVLGRLRRNRVIHAEYPIRSTAFGGSISTPCCSVRGHGVFFAISPARTEWCAAPTTRFQSATPSRGGLSTRLH